LTVELQIDILEYLFVHCIMVNFENGTRTPEQSQIDWETIEPTLLDTLQLDTQTDAVLI